MPEQQSFELRTWGGRRRGAGRPAAPGRGGVPHVAREAVRPYHPVHVTLQSSMPWSGPSG